MKLSRMRTDPKKVEEGVWVDGPDGSKFRIARMTRPQYEEHVRKGMMEEGLVNSGGEKTQLVDANLDIANDKLRKIIQVGVARHLLLGWDGIFDDAGNAVPYSAEKSEELLCNEEYHDLYKLVLTHANNAELFRVTAQKADVGNSQPT